MCRHLAIVAAVLMSTSAARAELPTLPQAIELARARAIVVAQAQAELGVADAQMSAARVSSLGNPYTEVQFDRGFTQPNPGERTGIVQAMTFTYLPVDIAGQRGKRIDEADRLIAWRKLGIVDARAIASAEAVRAWGSMAVSSRRMIEAHEGGSAAREQAKYFSDRLAAKATTLYEKSLAEAEIARWTQASAEASLRLTDARARFGQVTGTIKVDPTSPNTTIAPPPLRAAWSDERIERIVDATPLIARLVSERRYWESSIARYERERIPAVSFEVIAGRGAGSELRLGAGAVITLPVTRRFQGEIARAEAGRAKVNRTLELYRNMIVARLRAARDAIAAVETALVEVDASGLPALEQAVAAATEEFKAGKIDVTRPLPTHLDLALARTRRLDLVETAWRAYADLVVLSGDMP